MAFPADEVLMEQAKGVAAKVRSLRYSVNGSQL
jgi:hypothetical protein